MTHMEHMQQDEQEKQRAQRVRRMLFRIGKGLISLGIIYWILRQIDLGEFRTFVTGHTTTVLYVFLLALAQWAMEFTRFSVALRTGGLAQSPGRVFRAFLMGFSFRFVLPGNQGEIGKMIFVEGTPASRIAVYIYEKLGFVMALLLVFVVGFAWIYPQFVYVSIIIFGIILLVLILWNRLFTNQLMKTHLPQTLRRRRPLLVQIPLAAVTLTIISLQYYLFLYEAGLTLPETIAIVSIIMTVILIPITLAGLGLRESAAVVLLAPFGVSAEMSTAIPFIVFIINVAVPALIGAVLLVFSRSYLPGQKLSQLQISSVIDLKRIYRSLRTASAE
ncbi:MAG TPA: lysylphosphatidylglycerol synthase transmembrane domain-containing protein [bacterium]|nr:lysylphosphatidylglycerol synthase transmembrane domain-containing protein [bacterium]